MQRNKSIGKALTAAILFAAFAVCTTQVMAYTSPGKPSGYVNDFENVIPDAEETVIASKLKAIESTYGVEMVVVTVPSFGDESLETYAVKLFEDWGIGKKEKDNGLLILVSSAERAVRIEVGYGLESTITDLQSGNIINKVMVPAFISGNYGKGVDGGVDALSSILAKSPDAAEFSTPSNTSSTQSRATNKDLYGLAIFLFIFIANLLANILGKTKSWWLGGAIGAGVGVVIGIIFGFLYAGIVSTILLTILGLIFDFMVSKGGGRGGKGGMWFGPGTGGFGGGGFGGFGGGMSGGGGASGRW